MTDNDLYTILDALKAQRADLSRTIRKLEDQPDSGFTQSLRNTLEDVNSAMKAVYQELYNS